MKKRFLVLMLSAVLAVGSLVSAKTEVQAEELMIEEDITNLRDSFSENFGDGTYAGVSLTGNELYDPNIMALVTKHFNAVTLGNELKPDAMFGYSNGKAPELMTYDLNGEEFEAPKMDFSRAERMLDYFAEWNANNPDRQIKVRGHVLVWHSQTPEWFFHEDWNKKNDYVSPAEMDKRQEWYIKEVLEHFTGKYENLFYGWDVVNEAISDATGTYRTEAENGESLSNDTHGSNSSWWKVYQSNQYIINAFKYANKYAPEYVELYYNDYNECTPLKSNGIIELLQAVKDAEGTRIDGMGMQGHYDMSNTNGGQVKIAAQRYAEVVGNVSLTELDIKASDSYDGSEEETEKEYRRQAYKYKEIYQGLKELNEEGVTIRTITVWGVIDGNSWLQSQNNVGGGASGKHKQCPLLFDDNYQAKPLFWSLCNEEAPAKEEKVEEAADEQTSDETEVVADESADSEEVAASENDTNENVTKETVTETKEESSSGRTPIVAAILVIGVSACSVAAVKKKNDGKEDSDKDNTTVENKEEK